MNDTIEILINELDETRITFDFERLIAKIYHYLGCAE